MIPGSNLLRQALTVIAPQAVEYYAFASRANNEIGMQVATFADPVTIYGSFQAVPRNMYEQLGLDFNKNYATFYSTAVVNDVKRDRTGDQLGFNGKRWQVESSNDWQAVDGWQGVLCVEVPAP